MISGWWLVLIVPAAAAMGLLVAVLCIASQEKAGRHHD